jgi:hypothetical protein
LIATPKRAISAGEAGKMNFRILRSVVNRTGKRDEGANPANPKLSANAERAIALLDKWLIEDQEEHAATLEEISTSINENRRGFRPAF